MGNQQGVEHNIDSNYTISNIEKRVTSPIAVKKTNNDNNGTNSKNSSISATNSLNNKNISNSTNTNNDIPKSLTERVRNLVENKKEITNNKIASPILPTADNISLTSSLKKESIISTLSTSSNLKKELDTNIAADLIEPSHLQAVYPTVFHWASGGANVYLTGDFNNWNGKVPMHRSNNDFTLILDMPPGKYFYKFIVDGDWRHANDQPAQADDHGVVNNFVEVDPKNIYEFDYIDREESVADFKNATEEQKNASHDSNNPPALEYSQDVPACFHHQNGQNHTIPVNQGILSTTDYMKDPHILPPQLYDVFLNNATKFADPYVLPFPQNVTIHHLFNATPLVRSEEVLVIGITQRYQSKFVTTLFYKPNLKKVKVSTSH